MSNSPMYKTDFALVRGVQNEILFQVRDVDRHPSSLGNFTVTIHFIDAATQTVLLDRDMTLFDVTNSVYLLTIFPADMRSWEVGTLQWSLTVLRSDGSEVMLWTDLSYTATSWCRVLDGPAPGPALPNTLDPSNFTLESEGSYPYVVHWSWSSAIACAQQTGYPNPLQTVALTMAAFAGTVRLQGTLLSQPSAVDSDWFDVTTQDYTVATTSLVTLNSSGNYLWLRIGLQTQQGAVSSITVAA